MTYIEFYEGPVDVLVVKTERILVCTHGDCAFKASSNSSLRELRVRYNMVRDREESNVRIKKLNLLLIIVNKL